MHPFQRLLSAPASGYRNRTTGALGGIGTEGNYWSSSPAAASGGNVSYLYYSSGNVNPQNSYLRSNGFSVRCVQHLQAAFLKVKVEKLKVNIPT